MGMKPVKCGIGNKKHPCHGHKFLSEFQTSGDDVDQKDVRECMPPGCAIWRANFRAAWCYHVPPHPRGSEPWADHGGSSRKAALAAVRSSWLQFNADQGLPSNYCPVKGIFC